MLRHNSRKTLVLLLAVLCGFVDFHSGIFHFYFFNIDATQDKAPKPALVSEYVVVTVCLFVCLFVCFKEARQY